ncbi:isochorismate synthase [Natronosalvus halobius]|uniref:isochorismate synthase n=1 Tax=Natronosalvus halobius TaxID=2953746 RepID=UPI0020A19B62|nr:isochorismate synthase [Natronosalvus halobius]USZ72881.1 isochorismate synthase [Natronosalvus halobius]
MDRPSGQGRVDASGRATASATGAGRRLVSRSRTIGDVSFGNALEHAQGTRLQWATADGLELVGWGETARLSASGSDRFDEIRAQATTAFDGVDHDGPAVARPRAFGGFAFHDGHEPRDPWMGFAAATFVVPSVVLARTDEGTWLTAVDTSDDDATTALESWYDRLSDGPAMRSSGTGPGIDDTRRTTTREQWTAGVETALERIADGVLEKVVLAQALDVDLEGPLDVPACLERLRRRYPNCYRFLFQDGESGTFFGAPPERLVGKSGTDVRTEALAGSAPRGDTREADEELANRLLDSEKIRREHGIVVDTIRNQLEALAADIRVDERRVKRLATIQHCWTPIEATLEGGHHVLDVVEALHPTPAVGGIPPGAAWETIRDVETFDRGWYAAPIGWFDAVGDGEFAVGIRSGVAREDAVTLFAGNGIVADSDPDDEWDEVVLKYRPILDELRE